jgi:predicted ATPase
VRDAVLLRYGDLSAAGRAAAEAAAVAGERFELEAVSGLADEAGVGELLEIGLIREGGDGRAAFRHALVREALHRDVPWLRRRELHRQLGERLEAHGAPGVEVAPHWLGAHDEERARRQLLRAADEFEAAHAYRDAAGMAHHALELWPAGEEVEERLAALERHAACRAGRRARRCGAQLARGLLAVRGGRRTGARGRAAAPRAHLRAAGRPGRRDRGADRSGRRLRRQR